MHLWAHDPWSAHDGSTSSEKCTPEHENRLSFWKGYVQRIHIRIEYHIVHTKAFLIMMNISGCVQRTSQYIPAQTSTIQYSPLQPSAVPYSPIQPRTSQLQPKTSQHRQSSSLSHPQPNLLCLVEFCMVKIRLHLFKDLLLSTHI